MAQAKYRLYYQKMLAENQALFAKFTPIHQAYKENQAANQEEFNQLGQQVMEVLRDWDRRLCSAMGRSTFGVYSPGVSEKFWDLVRQDYDQIDMVGVKVQK